MKKYNFITKVLLIKEYKDKSIEKIAGKLRCSYEAIRRRLIKYNIPIRTLSEACKGINKGKKNNRYNPERHKKHYCIELGCNNEISYSNWYYGNRRCRFCDAKIRESSFKKGQKAWNKNIVRTKETKSKISLAHGGTGIPYEFSEYPEEFLKIKPKIRKRDNYTCQECGNKFDKYSSYLDIHHIDYDKNNNKENNLIALCHKCNCKANKNRDYWYAYFTYIMEGKI